MKKYLSLLISVLLILTAFPTVFLTSASDETDLYFNNFDTSYDTSEWTLDDPTTATVPYTYSVTRKTETTSDNGYLSVEVQSEAPNTVRATRMRKEINVSDLLNGQKPKLIMEYRYRVNGAKNSSYLTGKSGCDQHCYIKFESSDSKVYSDSSAETALGDVTIGEWNTITVLYDNASDKRTVYVNGGKGTEISNDGGNLYYQSGIFNPCLTAQINVTHNKSLDFDYIRIQAVPDTFAYSLSNITADSADVTFTTMPNPETVQPSAFKVNGTEVAAVTRKAEQPDTYTVTFRDTLAAGTYTLNVKDVVSADGMALDMAEQNFDVSGGDASAPDYDISYLYNYDFGANQIPDTNIIAGSGGAAFEQITDSDGNGVLRMTGADKTSLSEVGKSLRPRIVINSGIVAGNPNVVLEFRYRTEGFADGYESLRYIAGSSNGNASPVINLYNNSIHSYNRSSEEDTTYKIADAANGEWHTVSVMYSGTERKRTVVVDGITFAETSEGNAATAGNEYGTNTASSEFNLYMYGYFLKTTSIDFDYIRAYTYPDFTLKLPKTTDIATDQIDVDFSYFPALSSLNKDNIKVKEPGTDTVITSADVLCFNGTERQYTLSFADRLQPNTDYEIAFDVADIDGRSLSITCPFTTADPVLDIGALTIDKTDPAAVKAVITVANELSDPEEAVIMIGAFSMENGAERMKAFQSKEISFEEKTNRDYDSGTIDASALEGNIVLRAFLWTGENDMTPLTESVSLSLNES